MYLTDVELSDFSQEGVPCTRISALTSDAYSAYRYRIKVTYMNLKDPIESTYLPERL